MATAGSPSPYPGDSPEPSFSGEKVYVAVGEESSRGTLLWALHKFPQGTAFVLLHVYSPPNFLPILGAKIPAGQLREQELIAHKKMNLQRISDNLDQYQLICAQQKVQAEKLVVESDDVAYGLVDVISEHNVSMLVMGAADDKHYTKYACAKAWNTFMHFYP
uniref:UspA domain-containing protein n=1 Tax=Oryza sativa subsp. japonica TaxID=39947 RepID=Q652P0_ORYSJ|nr:hypothetical protein [Oryza sativa Japonica Group]